MDLVTMKCLEFETTGPATEVLRLATRNETEPSHGEVRVRMLASPVNPSDLMFIRGEYGLKPEIPQVPGFEGVGIVEQSGGGLRGRLFKGKRVAVLNRSGGNWAESAVVPASQVIPISSALSDEQAATFFVNPATAWIMTKEILRVPTNGWLVQTGAGSSLGAMVIRLAAGAGFRTLNIVRSDRHVDRLKAMGADEVVVFDPRTNSESEFHQQILEITNGHKPGYAIDCVGGETGSAVVRCLSHRGRMLVFGTLDNQPLRFSSRTLMTAAASIEGFWLGHFMDQQTLPFKLRLVRRITKLVQDGTLSSTIAGSFPISEFRSALEQNNDPTAEGKTILQLNS